MIQCFVLLKDNPLIALEFLKKNAVKFSAQKRAEIKAKIIEKLDSYGKEYLTRQTFEGNTRTLKNHPKPMVLRYSTLIKLRL